MKLTPVFYYLGFIFTMNFFKEEDSDIYYVLFIDKRKLIEVFLSTIFSAFERSKRALRCRNRCQCVTIFFSVFDAKKIVKCQANLNY